MKAFKYISVFIIILFYLYLAIQSGVAAAMVFFVKTLGIVLFGLSHIWLFDLKEMVQTIWRTGKCFSTRWQEWFQRSQSSSS